MARSQVRDRDGGTSGHIVRHMATRIKGLVRSQDMPYDFTQALKES